MTKLWPAEPDTVYVMTDGEQPIKIGISMDLAERLSDLTRETGRALEIVYSRKCEGISAGRVEGAVHAYFSERRAYGEWFNVSVAAAIDAIERAVAAAEPYEGRRPSTRLSEGGRLKRPLVVTGAQIRAGCGFLNWSMEKLAEAAGVSWATVQRMTSVDGCPSAAVSKIADVQYALEAAGIEFIGEDEIHIKRPQN